MHCPIWKLKLGTVQRTRAQVDCSVTLQSAVADWPLDEQDSRIGIRAPKILQKVVAPGISTARFRVRFQTEAEDLTINRQLLFVWLDNVFVFA
jgi:hypothetical protein